MKSSDILYETPSGKYFILKNKDSYDVYRVGLTHSTRCAEIGLSRGIDSAIFIANKNEEEDKLKEQAI
jgi:hypothetical protein